jgi:hypothetical protein
VLIHVANLCLCVDHVSLLIVDEVVGQGKDLHPSVKSLYDQIQPVKTQRI